MSRYSTRIATFNSSSTSLIVNGGDPIWLHDICVANGNAAAQVQTFTWSSGGAAISPAPAIAVMAGDSQIWGNIDAQCQSLALATTPASGVVVTILYREDG